MHARSWVLETAAVVFAAGIGLLLIEADRSVAAGGFVAAPEGALTLLVAVMFASVVLIALLAQLGAMWRPAVSALPAPRSTGPVAWLLAALTVAVLGLTSVRLGLVGRPPFTPPLTVLTAVALLAVGLLLYARYARALNRAANPYAVVATLGGLATGAADRAYPAACPPDAPEPPPLQLGRVIPATRSGYVVGVDVPRLVAAAARGKAIVRAPAVGGFIARGEPLLEIYATDGGRVPGRVATAVVLDDSRDPRVDAAFALGLLSDVAIGGLAAEPGIAEAALDRVGEVLGRLGPRPFPTGRFADSRGELRVLQPVVPWTRLVEIALSDVALRGAADPRVRDRLSALVDALSRRLPPERAAALAPYAPVPRPHAGPHAPSRRPPMRPPERHVYVEDLECPAR